MLLEENISSHMPYLPVYQPKTGSIDNKRVPRRMNKMNEWKFNQQKRVPYGQDPCHAYMKCVEYVFFRQNGLDVSKRLSN